MCGSKIVKGKYGWVCEKGCGASVPYELCQRKISPSTAESLFAGEKVGPLEGFMSKKGSPFTAYLQMNDEGKVTFSFND